MKQAKVAPRPSIPESETLAEAIVDISNGMRALESSGLNRKAIVLLLQDATGLSRAAIGSVLDALPKLKGMYCR